MGSEGMVDEERENGGAGAAECGGGVVGWNGDAINEFAIEAENGAVGDGNSAGSSCEGLRTYKRRRHTRKSSSDTKLLEDGQVAADSVSQLPDKTIKEPMDRALHSNSYEQVNCSGMDSHAVMSDLGDCPLNHWRNTVLEQWRQSLWESEGGLQGCIQDALLFHTERRCRTVAKGPVHNCEDDGKCTSKTGWMTIGTHNVAKGHVDVMSNGTLSESNHTNTDLCRRAFFDIVMSQKFAQLCSLLLENFQGIKVDSILDIRHMNSRMKEGAYERSPMLFHSDMHRLWTKLQNVGAEMVALAKSLSDKSRTTKFLTGESDLHTKPEQAEAFGMYKVCACRRCGEKADGRDCLVCDSCEEMYHVSCTEPAVEEIPLKSWYCANCITNGVESPHENCAVCEKLNASRPPNNGDDVLADEETFAELEEHSTGQVEHGLQLLKGGKKLHLCNVCGSEVDNSENFRVCGHPYCLHKYYHVRCLTSKQLGTYGPCWYCPSCLCRACLTDRDDENIVLCDGCDHAYHIDCMQPPRTAVPKGKWFCTKCDAGIKQIRKAKRAYENVQNKLKKRGIDGKGAFENLENAHKEKDEELVDKSGGVDMLLTAAKTLKYEEKMAAIEMKS